MSKKLPRSVRERFVEFAFGEISPREFEHWVYVPPSLEDYLAAGDYLALLESDYGSPGGFPEEAVGVRHRSAATSV